jgi:dynein heavy chain
MACDVCCGAQAAQRALETITSADIATVKKLGMPPHLIKRIMDVTLLLFGRKLDKVVPDDSGKDCPQPSWSEALKTMNGNPKKKKTVFGL